MTMVNQSQSDLARYPQEATITKKVKEWLEIQPDIHFYKASDRYHKGVSDLILCVGGIFVGVELKADKGRASAHQTLFIRNVRDAGGVAGVCYNLAEVKTLVEKARARL